ncbi:hypothetical protein BTHE_0795 [Bifidobacterium thermophilum]|nr:hypothetical protein BTHE_0795 [Bifidobacterium thermophilum]
MRKPSTPDSRLLHRRITGLNGEDEEVSRDDERDPLRISAAWIPARLSESADAIVCTLFAGFNAIPYLLFSSSLRAAHSTTLESRAMLCPTTAIPTLGCNRCHCFTLYNMLPTVDGMYHSVERSKAWAGAGSQCWTGSSIPQRAVARVMRVVWKSNHGTKRSGGLGSDATSLMFRGSVICEDSERRTMQPPRSPHPQYRIPKCVVRNGSRSKVPVSTANLSMAPVMQCRGAEPEG